MRIYNRLYFLKKRGGMTLVSVMVAFVVLLMLILMFSRTAILSQNMLHRSEEINGNLTKLTQQYYLNDQDLQREQLCTENEFVMTDGDETFTFVASVYRYNSGGAELYSFGENTLKTGGDHE